MFQGQGGGEQGSSSGQQGGGVPPAAPAPAAAGAPPRRNKAVWRDPASGRVFDVEFEGDEPLTDDEVREFLRANGQLGPMSPLSPGGAPGPGLPLREDPDAPAGESDGDRVLRLLGQAFRGLTFGGPAARGGPDGGPVPVEGPPVEAGAMTPGFGPPPVGGTPDPLGGVLATGVEGLSWVGNSARNFAQGALAPGLARYAQAPVTEQSPTSLLGAALAGAPYVLADVPGNVREGVAAVAANDGDRRVGEVVPSLAPDTLPGLAYNLGTAAGSDPLSFLGVGIGSRIAAAGQAAKAARAAGVAAEASEAAGAAAAGSLAARTRVRPAPRSVSGNVSRVPPRVIRAPRVRPRASGSGGAASAPVPSAPAPENLPAASAEPDLLDQLMTITSGPDLGRGAAPKVPPRGGSPATVPIARRPPAGRAPRGSGATAATPPATGAPPSAPASTAPAAAPSIQRTPPARGKGGGAVTRTLASTLADAAGVPKALMTAGDVSAVGRQGALLSVTRPRQAARASGRMIRAMLSEDGARKVAAEIGRSPYVELRRQAGVFFADSAGVPAPGVPSKAAAAGASGSAGSEEAFRSTLAAKLPLGVGRMVKASDRGYVSYLNSIRATAFDSTAESMIRAGLDPKKDADAFRALGRYVNSASGRGDLGALEPAAEGLAQVFFSPRLVKSRADFVDPRWWGSLTPAVRKVAARDVAGLTAATVGVMATATAAGADVEWDPTSGDFGKARFGKTRVDLIPAGAGPWVRFAFQQFGGEKNGEKMDGPGRIASASRRAEATLSPAASLLLEAVRGTTFDGREFTWTDAAAQRLVPLVAQDVAAAMREHGALSGLLVASPAFVGAGVQTYEEGGGSSSSRSSSGRERRRREDLERAGEEDDQRRALEQAARLRSGGRGSMDESTDGGGSGGARVRAYVREQERRRTADLAEERQRGRQGKQPD